MEHKQEAKPIDHKQVTEDEWEVMASLLQTIYAAQAEDGEDLARMFRKMVNKRVNPDYYRVIREPTALSQIKEKIKSRSYDTFFDFTRDLALICYNAQIFNRPEARPFVDSVALERLLNEQLKELGQKQQISEDTAQLPFIGEIPPSSPRALESTDNRGEGQVLQASTTTSDHVDEQRRLRGQNTHARVKGTAEDEQDPMKELGADGELSQRGEEVRPSDIQPEDDEDEEDDDDDEDEDEVAGGGEAEAEGAGVEDEAHRLIGGGGSTKPEVDRTTLRPLRSFTKRGRPPRVDTPLDARIKAVLRGLRRPRNRHGELLFLAFERLPDRAELPQYYDVVKFPMTLDILKRRAKRRRYRTMDAFMTDVNLLFENAKLFNEDDSQVFQDAVDLQKEASVLAAAQEGRPDSQFIQEDGRVPRPDGFVHAGELWKTGDWVLIHNKNDPQKPIIGQIHRTWENKDGSYMFNACWYYRPEQTVHHHEKRFFDNEVVKTGQYRDHVAQDIEDRCFVMYVTRYGKGRPRGLAKSKQVFVCEARYNEEQKKFNKIKTWSSCLPDEIRDDDYEMDLFPAAIKLRKNASPLKHLLVESSTKDDDMPLPTWGVEDAPPLIGAVHRRPRELNHSPPQSRSPSPPPLLGQAIPRDGRWAARAAETPSKVQHSGQNSGIPDSSSTLTELRKPDASFSASNGPSGYMHSAMRAAPDRPSRDVISTKQDRRMGLEHAQLPRESTDDSKPRQPSSPSSYVPPPPSDLYRLSTSVNSAIPDQIRRQYVQDSHGRILMFTHPPVVRDQAVRRTGVLTHTALTKHSGRYCELLKEKSSLSPSKRGHLAHDRNTVNHSCPQIKRRKRSVLDDLSLCMAVALPLHEDERAKIEGRPGFAWQRHQGKGRTVYLDDFEPL